jgi:hypothetical protein
MIYSLLYESMLGWYARRRVSNSYLHLYAVTTLTSMGFGNIGSMAMLLAHYDHPWAKKLFTTWPIAVVLFIGLLLAHLFYFRRGQSILAPRSAAHTHWIAPAYILVTVIVFLYTSTLTRA